MTWKLHVARSAEKELKRIPSKDRDRIISALQALCNNPFSGDIARLSNQPTAWRRRIGDWRIFYDLYPDKQLIAVAAIRRRSSTTY